MVIRKNPRVVKGRRPLNRRAAQEYEKTREIISKLSANKTRNAIGFRDSHGIEFGVCQNITALIISGNPARAKEIYQAEISGGKRPTSTNYKEMIMRFGRIIGTEQEIIKKLFEAARIQ